MPNVKFHQILFYLGILIFVFSLTQFLTSINQLDNIQIDVINGKYSTGNPESDRFKLESILEVRTKRLRILGAMTGGGLSLILIGFKNWFRHQKKLQIKFCQSCGKKFNSMVRYGKNKDKSTNQYFCSSCYNKGKFKNPNLTKEDVYNRIITELNKNDRLTKYLVKKHINKLERWKKHHYE